MSARSSCVHAAVRSAMTGFVHRFIGDELLWGGLPFSDFARAISLVRTSFPRPFILYANEAWGSVVNDMNARGQKIGFEHIPADLDWFSMDLYKFRLDNRTIDTAAWTLTEEIYTKFICESQALC